MITKSQLKERKHHLGASDISSIYGVNPFMTATELWMKKIYSMQDTEISEAMSTGIELETPIVNWIAKKLKLEIDTNPENLYYIYEKDNLFAANLDANVLNYPTAIEGKYSGKDIEWNESDTGSEKDIPGLYYIQCQAQMMCTNFDYIILALWLSGFHGFEKRYYMVQRDNERIEKLAKIGRLWWNKHVLPALDCSRNITFHSQFLTFVNQLIVFS